MDDEQKMDSNPVDVEMSDINPANDKEDDDAKKIGMITVPTQNGNGTNHESQSEKNANGVGLISKKKRQPIASFQIKNEGIEHDVCVALRQEGGLEDDLEKEKEEEEIQVSSPMMIDKPAEMRPYSVALDVLFRRKELKSKRKKMCLIALTILLAILLIGGIIAVLIVFLGDIGGPDPDPVAIQGEFRISNRDYNAAYSNPETTEYKQLEKEFISQMDSLYMNSTSNHIYINTKVSGFRDGSIVVAFVVNLKRMSNQNTPSKGDNVDDNDTTNPDEDENQTNLIYKEAVDLILISVDDGRLGNLEGTVINLTLVPGEGRPVEGVTIPTAAATSPRITTRPKTSTAATTSSTTEELSTTAVTSAITSQSSASTTMSAVTSSLRGSTGASITETQTDGDSLSYSSSELEDDYNLCEPNPCMHGATCVSFLGAFCQCPPGFYGTLCESDSPPDPCDPNPCENGGNCTSFIGRTMCTCGDEYYGKYCEDVLTTFPSSSYDYFSDSITFFPTNFPFPGHELNCEQITIQECLDILPFNTSAAPNPHGMGNTMADIKNQYDELSMYINSQCHDDGTKVLCSMLHTKCTKETTNLFMAYLQTYIPCRSLCFEVGDACSGSPMDIDELCDALPESAHETICYRSPRATGPLSCTLDFCQNNGLCFVMMNETMCRCQEGFIGERCEIEAIDPCLSNPCQNQGRCETETQSLPGIPMLYICYCQDRYYGQNCEFVDETIDPGVVDTPDPGADECGGNLLIPECAELVPYNISNSAAVRGDQYKLKDWPVILNRAEACHRDAAIFICATMQRKCTHEGPIPPCRALCERVATSCNITAFALPSDSCLSDTYSDSLHQLDCFDITYEG